MASGNAFSCIGHTVFGMMVFCSVIPQDPGPTRSCKRALAMVC